MNIRDLQDEYKDDIGAVSDWCDEIYAENFAQFFKNEKELYQRLQSKTRPITDEELEWILTMLPLELFSVAEGLNKLKLGQEVVKLRIKEKTVDYESSSTASTATKRQEEASIRTLGDKLLATAYATVISRVESEMSFSRELIMSAKKLWDARRIAEQSNPVGEVTAGDDLPEYKESTAKSKTYIQ